MLSVYDIATRVGLGNNSYVNSFFATYAVLMAKKTSDAICSSFEELVESGDISEERKITLLSVLGKNLDVELVFNMANEIKEAALIESLLNSESYDGRDESETPISLINLANEILDLNKANSIADFGSGYGNYIISAKDKNSQAVCTGFDINCSLNELARIKSELLGVSVEFENGQLFDLINGERKFDRVFSNYPWMYKCFDSSMADNQLIKKVVETEEGILRPHSSDWAFNTLIVGSLSNNGKGIGIMTCGSTWNSNCKSVRKYFVDNGYVEAIIALPQNMFNSTSIPTIMIVLSHNNKEITMVDARKVFVKGRRTNSFSEDNIAAIVEAYRSGSDISKRIKIKDIIANDYSLDPGKYMTEKITFESGVEFGSLIKNITRGAQITAATLDELTSNEKTDYQYLMIANVKDGVIDSNLPYIKEIDRKQEKYCLKNNCLIMSKNGLPIKIAVAEVPEGKKILANGNLYIIELDETKVSPYYVKAFFETEIGSRILQSITVGATIPNIPVEALKTIEIPLLEKEEMEEIVTRYLAKHDEMRLYRNKLEKAQEELKHIFNV